MPIMPTESEVLGHEKNTRIMIYFEDRFAA